MVKKFSRQELYELVWSIPISTLSGQFGLSDRGLAKICERHHIPVPGRGYWARLEAGQAVTKTPLWKLDNPAIQEVVLGWHQHLHPEVAFAKEATQRAKAEQKAKVAFGDGESAGVGGKVSIRADSRLHPSLASFAKELRSAAGDYEGGIKVRWVQIHRDSIPRVLNFLNTLAYELEAFGIRFSSDKSRVAFLQGSTAVDFEITSPKKRIDGRPGSWRRFENVFVGRLALQLFGQADGIKKNWIDKDGVEIETKLAAIISSIQIGLTVQAEIDERRRSEERRRAFDAHRKELEKKRQDREQARQEYLDAIAQDRQEVQHLRETISLLPANTVSSSDFDRMIEWARGRLAELEERTTPRAIQRALQEKRLFPEPDDLADPCEYEDVAAGERKESP